MKWLNLNISALSCCQLVDLSDILDLKKKTVWEYETSEKEAESHFYIRKRRS